MIVNGEPRARAHLHQLRANRPDLKVIAEAASGLQALNALEDGAADLLLVDSRLPGTRAARDVDARWAPQIIGEKASRIYFLDVHDVEYLASAGNYVTTHRGGHEFLTRTTLKSMSALLTPLGFAQIARTLLVNLRQVAHVERCDRGQFCFVTRTGHRLVSSRERGADLRNLLLGATLPQHL